MAYIGKSPAVGNFVKLDAISTSSTNTYNLTVDSVAFVPESANHMLVSLNGVIQAPLSSFSVSGSTITFIPASGTLSSSDSIDFIMVYGNVLDIGTPSDSTVTNAKTNFVSTSSSAGLQIKGDNTTAGTLQLNCEQNSHGIKLRSPSHSASASYTLTFPTTDGNADEFLKTDGSGALSWASAGGTNTPSFFAVRGSSQSMASGTDVKIQLDTEQIDTASAYDSSTNFRFTVPSGQGGKYYVTFQIRRSAWGSNILRSQLRVNGSTSNQITAEDECSGINDYASAGGSGILSLSAGDYIELYGYQNTGSNQNVYGSATDRATYMGAFKLVE